MTNRGMILIGSIAAILILIVPIDAQIHRASNKHDYQIKYESNFTANYLLKKFNFADNANQTNGSRFLGIKEEKLLVWASTVLGTFFVGICGIVPVIILPQLADDHTKLVKSPTFNCLVSFAAGSLLGDVFIHLLPEAYSKNTIEDHSSRTWMGIWLLMGLLAFLSIEKLFPDDDEEEESQSKKEKEEKSPKKFKLSESIKTFGILNAAANIVDNFTHGIAVAGSFQASFKFGVMTLIATLLHEIPHEIGDFAILLKSGLNYRQAAVAQLTTAFSGIIGAIFALNWSSAEEAGNATCWILPFTSGGFLYIALVNIVPDLLKETDPRQSLRQTLSLLFGIFVIYAFNFLFE